MPRLACNAVTAVAPSTPLRRGDHVSVVRSAGQLPPLSIKRSSRNRAELLPVDRQRRVWSDEPLFAQVTPEVVRDDGRECGMVCVGG